jgi:hypothetical protein
MLTELTRKLLSFQVSPAPADPNLTVQSDAIYEITGTLEALSENYMIKVGTDIGVSSLDVEFYVPGTSAMQARVDNIDRKGDFKQAHNFRLTTLCSMAIAPAPVSGVLYVTIKIIPEVGQNYNFVKTQQPAAIAYTNIVPMAGAREFFYDHGYVNGMMYTYAQVVKVVSRDCLFTLKTHFLNDIIFKDNEGWIIGDYSRLRLAMDISVAFHSFTVETPPSISETSYEVVPYDPGSE